MEKNSSGQGPLNQLRTMPMNDLVLQLYNIINADNYNKRPSSNPNNKQPEYLAWDAENNDNIDRWIGSYSQVIGERFLINPIPLTYFNGARDKGYFEDEKVNARIAQHIPINAGILEAHPKLTLEILKTKPDRFKAVNECAVLLDLGEGMHYVREDFSSVLTLKEKLTLIEQRNANELVKENERVKMFAVKKANKKNDLEQLKRQEEQNFLQETERLNKKQQEYGKLQADRQKQHKQLKKNLEEVGADAKKQFDEIGDEIKRNEAETKEKIEKIFKETQENLNKITTGQTDNKEGSKKKRDEPVPWITRAGVMKIIVGLLFSVFLYSILTRTA